MIELGNMFFEGADWGFVTEIIGRTIVMFLLIILILRLSGRRGVRQLTLFEVAIILSLGSAAGDPMFQNDIPVIYALVVFGCVILIYKLFTYFTSRFEIFSHLLEGKAMVIIKDGAFHVKNEKDNNFSEKEFFSELRNQSVEHLGQVRLGVLEVDGTLSLLFYSNNDVKYGLPLFPTNYCQVDPIHEIGLLSCMYCGFTTHLDKQNKLNCQKCQRDKWTRAMNTKRIG